MSMNAIIKLIFLSMILFILTNYFVKADQENNMINNIISQCDTEDDIEKLYSIKRKYMSCRFNLILTRSIFFAILLYLSVSYFNFKELSVVVSTDESNLYYDIDK